MSLVSEGHPTPDYYGSQTGRAQISEIPEMPEGAIAAIFDLDGVLTSTSAKHEQSWKDAAEHFGFPVTAESLRATRSVPRATSLAALLAHAGLELDQATREAVMAFKNARYKDLIAGLQPSDAFPGARDSLTRCRALGLRTGVASASQNVQTVLKRIGLIDFVDYVADSRAAAPKPSPDIYSTTGAALGVDRHRTICIEDGGPIISNLRAEGFYTVGIGPDPLGAHEQAFDIANWDVAASVARVRR
jgi:HAD superfamily hydrolase (TIGR01509 family)